MNNNNQPNSHAAGADVNALSTSVETVKALLAAGILDPTSLGLPTLTGNGTDREADPQEQGLPTWFMVPGEPITVRDLITKTKAGLKPSTLRAYGCYLDLLAEGYDADGLSYPGIGDMDAHKVLPSDLKTALAFVKQRALNTAAERATVRRSVGRAVRDSTGEGACYNAVGAWRRAFSIAVQDRHLARQFNPAQDLAKPKRAPGKRRPLKSDQMADFWAVVQGTGDDPELDSMMVETILISGARREGLFNLTLSSIDRDECTLRLDEKFDKVVYQPVPDWFAAKLYDFAVDRAAKVPGDAVFCYLPKASGVPGRPATSRRLDNLFGRIQSTLAWADRDQVTAHTLRHHAIGLVERHAGRQVATAFARHAPEDTNSLYGRASREEVAQAVVDLYGGDHPWLREN